MREMSSCVCICKPQNLGIHQAGPRYYWYSPCVSTLRICDFRVFFRSRFRASKTAATNGHTTVCDRSWPPFLGSPGGPCFEIVFFFYGLEIQACTVYLIPVQTSHPHTPHPCTPGRARSLPPPPPSLSSPLALSTPSSYAADPLAHPPLFFVHDWRMHTLRPCD